MKLSRIFASLGAAMLAASLLLPSVNGMWGIVATVFGAASIVFDPPWFIVWCANPLILTAIWLRMRGKRVTLQRFLPLLALACALYATQAESIVLSESGSAHLVTLQLGYYLWVGGILSRAVAALVAVRTTPTWKTAEEVAVA